MSTKTARPPDRSESIAESDAIDRLTDLRRRRADLVDVLAETLFERILTAPRGPRQQPPRALPKGGASV